jgi:hypothetical protein
MVVSTTTSTGSVLDIPRRPPAAAWALAAVELLVSANAVLGGVQLIRTGYGIPPDWLAHTPFDDFTWPGILLLGGVAVPQLLAAIAALVPIAGSRRLGWIAGYLAGGSLVAWIAIQLVLLRHFFVLQPVVVGFGLVEITLAEWLRRRSA